MKKQIKAKMFLADERGQNEADWFSIRQTFNFGKYFNEHKKSLGDLYRVSDEVLDAGRSITQVMEEYSHVILLPVMGAIALKDLSGKENLIAAGQVQILTIKAGDKIEITNPFREGLVNFLQLWIKADASKKVRFSNTSTYDVNIDLNKLQQIFSGQPNLPQLPFIISMAKFEGRGETIYQLKNRPTVVFAFVIEGAFEVEGRLLHARDGLAVWETNELEIEAFSNEAIILLLELPLK